jgi:hypothetical protein
MQHIGFGMVAIWAWTYESSAVGDVQSHLLDIVRVAERRNVDAGVSGVLAYDAYGFFQVLEGDFDAITDMRTSILRDRRHRVNWQRLVERPVRRIPACLPLAYIRADIPHCRILRPDNSLVIDTFEQSLLVRAIEKYPTCYAQASLA